MENSKVPVFQRTAQAKIPNVILGSTKLSLIESLY